VTLTCKITELFY